MENLHTLDWAYLHGVPNSSATLKAHTDNFQVAETLSFTPTGEGEHTYLFIEKVGLNTGYVAQCLAKHFGISEVKVGFAGRKDKHARTQQWFSVQSKNISQTQIEQFQLEGTSVLDVTRHAKKLQTGAIKSNQFEILLTDLSPDSELESRLQQVATSGVPNYFGQQRFGMIYDDNTFSNLKLAERLIAGETIKKREKRSLAISALRSWLFNQFVSKRISTPNFLHPQQGDVFNLAGSNSFFVADDIDASIVERVKKRDITLAAPLWGLGDLKSKHLPLEFEKEVVSRYPEIAKTLESLGLKQERRALFLFPQDFEYEINNNALLLRFSLPKGCFATSVIRELVALNALPH